MKVEEALVFLDRVLPKEGLSDLQELVFRQCWEGKTYAEIGESSGYDTNYIKDVGSKLWKLLSKALGEPVTKSNLQAVLRRTQKRAEQSGDLRGQGDKEDKEDKGTRGQGENYQLPITNYQLPIQNLKSKIQTRVDWGEAVDVSGFYDRTEELNTLQQSILSDRCRLVAILGMGGMGKTA
jgi:hypothetical protein